MKPFFLIMNPASRGGRSQKKFSLIHRFFRDNGLSYDYAETKSLEDAETISACACRDGYQTIVAVGGDGTINKVLNGMYKNGERISDARLGVIYCGTSPDFCKSYGVPVKLEQSLATLKKGNETEILPGMIRFAKEAMPSYGPTPVDDSERFQNAVFACCANIGIGADLAEAANSGIRKVVGDFLGTFLSLGKTLAGFKPKRVFLDVDESRKTIEVLHNLSVGKTFHVASGIKIKNDLTAREGRLYTLAVKDLTMVTVPLCLKSIYSGKDILNSNIFEFGYCKTIEVTSDDGTLRVEFDGDPAGYLPCRIRAASGAIRLITEGCHV